MKRRTLFVCANQRAERPSCGQRCDTARVAEQLSMLARSLGAGSPDILRSRCLGRCPDGPVLGIVPDNVWYRYENTHDLQEIVDQHLAGEQIVERLLLSAGDVGRLLRTRELS